MCPLYMKINIKSLGNNSLRRRKYSTAPFPRKCFFFSYVTGHITRQDYWEMTTFLTIHEDR